MNSLHVFVLLVLTLGTVYGASHICDVVQMQTDYTEDRAKNFMTLTLAGWTLNKTMSGLNIYTTEQLYDRILSWQSMKNANDTPVVVFQKTKEVQMESCCAGWSGALCDQASCDPPCINGNCTSPNTCVCNNGFNGYSCDEDETENIMGDQYCYKYKTCSGEKLEGFLGVETSQDHVLQQRRRQLWSLG
ncbi:hypothetical protein DPMN_060901 [Dreissena polymorpha]|uniref:EGF-like domain-containing protein n=1 Tax=Dreissena polymorpha TaxID=45954 RepID=A0A9D4C6L0_DREPO|nr:hypothetical protein DPMN_060901 [Dreissena polymorpha]